MYHYRTLCKGCIFIYIYNKIIDRRRSAKKTLKKIVTLARSLYCLHNSLSQRDPQYGFLSESVKEHRRRHHWLSSVLWTQALPVSSYHLSDCIDALLDAGYTAETMSAIVANSLSFVSRVGPKLWSIYTSNLLYYRYAIAYAYQSTLCLMPTSPKL